MKYKELSSLLFHGSYAAVSKIDLNIGVLKKDFGKGFYTTNSRNGNKIIIAGKIIQSSFV